MNDTEKMTIIRTAYEARKALAEADKACDANPIIDGRKLSGYIAIEARWFALRELVHELGLSDALADFINTAEGRTVYSHIVEMK